MEKLFRLNRVPLAITPGTKIIKREAYQAFCAAEDIIRLAEKRAEEILDKAYLDREEHFRQGYMDGQKEGQREFAEKMIDLSLEADVFISETEAAVANIVTSAMHKILGDMDLQERITAVVKEALYYVRNQQRVTVRVASAELPMVKEMIDETLAAHFNIQALDVVGDPELAPGSCLLDSNLGIVDACVSTQLETLTSAIERRFSER